jgi:hypothetical protein
MKALVRPATIRKDCADGRRNFDLDCEQRHFHTLHVMAKMNASDQQLSKAQDDALVSPGDFLVQLAALMDKNAGNLTLSQHASNSTGAGDPAIHISALDGKDCQFATNVTNERLAAFLHEYNDIVRTGMTAGMKKRDRKKKSAKKLGVSA